MAQPLLKQIASLKAKDVPAFAKTTFTVKNMGEMYHGWVEEYHKKHILTGSVKPLNDLMLFVGVLAYAVAWPTEIRHLKHAEEAAKHGDGGHH